MTIDIDDAINALLAYQQADMEGTMVLTSRQAIHEVANEIRRIRAVAQPSRAAIIEECAQAAEAQKETFLSPQYASNQPFGSLCERFACDEVAKAIRALAIPSTDRGGA